MTRLGKQAEEYKFRWKFIISVRMKMTWRRKILLGLNLQLVFRYVAAAVVAHSYHKQVFLSNYMPYDVFELFLWLERRWIKWKRMKV